MKPPYNLKNLNYASLLLYQVKKYPRAALLSFVITLLLACLLYFFINKLYPDFNPLGRWTCCITQKHSAVYTFYSGPKGGTYYEIGRKLKGRLDDGGPDSIN